VESSDGRYLVETGVPESEVEARLSRVFGVAWFAKATVTGADYSSISAEVVDAARGGAGTFMVAARRSDKSFPIGSVELARRLGSEVVAATDRKVSLSDPSTTIHVDVLKGRALVYAEKMKGPGGLPVGTAGKVMHLFSGGIDSPVAAWLLMKRGCQPVYLHFYSAPDAEYALKSKVAMIVRILTEYSGRSNLLLMPFAEYQVATADAPTDAEPSLFRRFMRMTAETLAPRFSASAISTGDSLSQAASQTLWNIAVFDSGSSLPILRPVLGYDKEEIVALARRMMRKASGYISEVVESPPGTSIHYVGTCRMAADRKGGIVDRDLNYFRSKNLYVCDGSVIPVLSEKHPTLTVMALAHRLAEHLIKINI
jgi:thiamine biosynthesis protein ThiI